MKNLNQSRNFGLKKNTHTHKLLDPRDQSIWEVISFKLVVAVDQWAACLDWGEGNLIPVSVLFALPHSEFGVNSRLASAASCPHLHWNATVLSSIDTRRK